MLFRKKIEPCCSYCARGTAAEEGHILCAKRGIVSPHDRCRSFRYDPLRRTPPPPARLKTEGLSASDFSLEEP
ncbi:MAG: hypothetical protein IIY71_01255 [Oscillospiraceae bacterium]|nr:hypothetical protein [Oscillospiraceae bacterium]